MIFIFWWMSSFDISYLKTNIELISTGLTLVGILVSFGILYITHSSIERRKAREYKKWEEKEENAKYRILVSDLSHARDDLRSVEDELKEND